MKESEIQKSILDTLNEFPNTFAFRVHSTGVPDRAIRGGFRKNPNKGIADIMFCKNGRFGAIEVKREGKNAEPHQREWLLKVADAKGHASVCHNVAEAIESWKEV